MGSKEAEGRATHEYFEKVEEGKTVKRRRCLHGPVDLREEVDMAKVVAEQARLSHDECMIVRVRHKEMNDNKAFATFLASEKLKRHLQENKTINISLFTLSWFISNKPIQVKFPSRNTSQCTHCEQALTLGGNGLQLHKKASPGAPAEETAEAAAAVAPPTPPGIVPNAHGTLHGPCGKAGGCPCPHCADGKCRDNHPFMGDKDGMEAVKKLGKATMCDKIDGVRLWDCTNKNVLPARCVTTTSLWRAAPCSTASAGGPSGTRRR